jgi:hypothetical protein
VVVTEFETARFDKRPTDVMFGWAAPVTLWANGMTPTTFAPVMFERPEAFPTKRPAFMMPETAREERVPTDVMFGCEEAVTERAVGTVETFEPLMFESPEAFEAVSKPWTVREERVPTEVMLGCEAAVTL